MFNLYKLLNILNMKNLQFCHASVLAYLQRNYESKTRFSINIKVYLQLFYYDHIRGRDLVSGEAADVLVPPVELPGFTNPSTWGLSCEPVRHNNVWAVFLGDVFPVNTFPPPVSADPARFSCAPRGLD